MCEHALGRGTSLAERRLYMHVSRVTQKAAEGAAAGGSAADALAALFGEASATGATFPVTLQEAIAGGEVPVDAGAVIVDDGGSADDGAAVDDGDETTLSLEAALAAAGLDLGAAANPVPQPEDAAAATDGTVAVGADAASPTIADGSLPGTTSALVDAAAATAKAKGAQPAAAGGQTVEPTLTAADGHATPPSSTTTATDAGRPVPATTGSTDGAATGLPTAGLDAKSASQPATSGGEHATHAEGKSDHAPDSHPREGFAAAAVRAPFSSGGDGRQGLDLGTPEREQAGTAEAVKRAAAAVAVATTSTGRAADPLHLPTAATPAERSEGAAPPPPPPPGPTHTTTTAIRAAHATTASSAMSIEARWGERVADALRLSAVRGGGEIRLQLEPEGLGHIDVRVHLQSDGVRAVIVAEHESTRALLQSQQHVLEDALARGDVRLSGFSVDVGSGGGAASFAASSDHERDGRPGDAANPAAGPPEPAVETYDANAGGRLSVRV